MSSKVDVSAIKSLSSNPINRIILEFLYSRKHSLNKITCFGVYRHFVKYPAKGGMKVSVVDARRVLMTLDKAGAGEYKTVDEKGDKPAGGGIFYSKLSLRTISALALGIDDDLSEDELKEYAKLMVNRHASARKSGAQLVLADPESHESRALKGKTGANRSQPTPQTSVRSETTSVGSANTYRVQYGPEAYQVVDVPFAASEDEVQRMMRILSRIQV